MPGCRIELKDVFDELTIGKGIHEHPLLSANLFINFVHFNACIITLL
jgi:hypothetical protein